MGIKMNKPKRVKKRKLIEPEPPEEHDIHDICDPLNYTNVETLFVDGAGC
jgi:hypothetical protein